MQSDVKNLEFHKGSTTGGSARFLCHDAPQAAPASGCPQSGRTAAGLQTLHVLLTDKIIIT